MLFVIHSSLDLNRRAHARKLAPSLISATILFFLSATSAVAQDSAFVRETCQKIQALQNKKDLAAQTKIIEEQNFKFESTIAKLPKDIQVQETFRFQYKLNRQLKKSCPGFAIERVQIKGQAVIDLEEKFSKGEVDSLKRMIARIQKEKGMHIYIVTIDDLYPDTSIEYFSNRNREFWGNEYSFEKGTVMMAYSFTRRELRISTGIKSMEYLTDEECKETIDFITSFFKRGEFFTGVVAGLYNLKEKI